MKIFYFSTACNTYTFEKIVKKSKKKPSASAQTFETSFLNGFDSLNETELNVNSFVPIAAYPGGYKLFWGRRKEYITKKIPTTWIPAVNIQIIKQICYKVFSSIYLERWLKENIGEKNKCVVMYSLYPPIAEPVLKLCSEYNCKCFVFIADLPGLQFTTSEPSGIKKRLAPFFRKNAVSLQNNFDGYVFFTEQMSEVVGKGKPYIVIEGVCNTSNLDDCLSEEKSKKRSIMYAGMLYEKYGIDLLLNSFMKLEGDFELWLFGDGDYVEKIKKCAAIDSRIKYFGRVSHDEALRYEKQAHLLVNVRNDREEYTKYSFPSKTMEYMLSGTPVLTSKLSGIPVEYYDHMFTLESFDVDTLVNKFKEIFTLSDEKRAEIGAESKAWLLKNKNAEIQVQKLINFLDKLINY